MAIDDETLMAYADGELAPAEAARVEAAMDEDPTLAARIARFRGVRRALKMAYDDVTREPIPEHLRALLGDVALNEPEDAPTVAKSAPVVDIAAAREQRKGIRIGPPAWAAIAASLIAGVIAGRATLPQAPFAMHSGQLYAQADLGRALDGQLASEQGADDATRVGISFRSNDGGYCRTFSQAEQGGGVAGLACRDTRGWAVRMTSADAGPGGDYRQAGADAPAVLALVDQLIEGDPLDAAQERAARDAKWRR